MSRTKKQSWVVATITTIIMMLSTLGSIPTASAAPGDPIIPSAPSCAIALVSGDFATAPPAPTCYDPSGSDLDEFLVPNITDANGNHVGYEDGNWNPYKWDAPNSTNGASQVFVQSTHYDSTAGGYVNGPAWTLTFNQAVVGVEAGESYRAEVLAGTCNPATSQWQVNWFARNLADATQRYVRVIDGSVSRLADDTSIPPGGQDTFLHVERVFDGQEASLGIESMFPGTYKFAASKSGSTTGWQSWRLQVPSCGKVRGPEAGPVSGGVSAVPTGNLRQVSPTKMRAVVNGRKTDYSALVKIIINPTVGKTRVRVLTLKAGAVVRKTYRATPGTKFVMKARVRQEVENGRYTLKWKVLKRATLRKR